MIGVWLVGAYSNVATTAVVGARAIVGGVVDTTGMVTARPPCTRLDLPRIDDLTFGGHDVRDRTVAPTVAALLGVEEAVDAEAPSPVNDSQGR